MSLAFTLQLDLKTWKTNVRAQKIDGTTLKTYGMIIIIFSVLDKDSKVIFFKRSFLLVDIKPNIVLEMFFLTISNTNINF